MLKRGSWAMGGNGPRMVGAQVRLTSTIVACFHTQPWAAWDSCLSVKVPSGTLHNLGLPCVGFNA